MQGSIFTAFADMIIEKMGMATWNALLEEVKPASEGVYTNGMQYEDNEMMAYVAALSKKTNIAAPDLVRSFGQYLFIRLYNSSPASISHIDNLKDFLRIIDSVIHKEVKRVYPDAYLPRFDYTENEQGDLIMYYQSKRKLCHLSEGLILSAAEHFNQKIVIEHPQCMHNNADKCKLVIQFKDN